MADGLPDIDPTPADASDDVGPELLPEPPADDGVVDSGVSGLAWIGAFALLAVGVVAVVLTSAVWAPWALAVGVVAVASVVLAEVFGVVGGPVAAAMRAAQTLAKAGALLLQGKPSEAFQVLTSAKAADWFWLVVLTIAALAAWRKWGKKWQ